jgi:hypothetical protein
VSGDETKNDQTPADRTEVHLNYSGASGVAASGEQERVALVTNDQRPGVRASGMLRDPVMAREALSVLYEIVGSDYRYVPRDRTAYMAYRQLRSESSGLSAWAAQQAYFDWLARNDPLAWLILDPVVSVHPDELSFEVFSKDEGTYARLAIDWSAVDLAAPPTCGTTNIDFSESLFKGVQRMRSYRATSLDIGEDVGEGGAVGLDTEGTPEVIEKKIQLPDTWIRGFLQVQSASTLPDAHFSLAPIDLYNVLRHLRMNADIKKKPRGIRVELVPGEAPRLVLEPWEEVIPCTAGPYKGKAPRVMRIWGRRRLMMLRRFLPFVERVDVSLMGSGLPSFYVLRAGPLSLTVGLSGFTAANWVQAAAFDMLLPRRPETDPAVEKVLAHLQEHWMGSAASISEATGVSKKDALAALQQGCQNGQLMYDLAREVYRYRPLLDRPLDLERLRYRDDRERQAHDLLNTPKAVQITEVNRIPGTGVEVTGKVAVAADRREYRVQLLLGEDGRVRKADDTSSFFRKHGLKQGPSVPLLALLLAWNQAEAERKAKQGRSRKTVQIETRVYVQRDEVGEHIYRLSLNQKRLRIQWGLQGRSLRTQNLFFNSVSAARDDYFARVDDLEGRGFIDATAG